MKQRTVEDKRTIYILIILIASGLLLILVNNIEYVRVYKNLMVRVMFPSSRLVMYPLDKIDRACRESGKLLSLYSENKRLKKEIESLNLEYKDIDYLKAENASLKETMRIRQYYNADLIPATIISHYPEEYFASFNISKGKKDGVGKDMPVIGVIGTKWVLLGRIDEVYDDFSRVILITASNFRCAAELSDGSLGVVKGNNEWIIKMEYISPNANISKGDEVYTSGTGGIFPSGLFIGRVSDSDTLKFSIAKEAYIEADYYPQNSKYVYVLKK
ncbi:MAG: rod shape-determining protein MreC [Elusimicrobia bacterium]|nr:rod shape-determining protein MreC [Elusimicrobiota bacterium]